MKQSSISAAVREPMLSAGQIDAVTGFSYLSAINLRDRGVPADDLAVLQFADYGCEAYGFAVIVNPALCGRQARGGEGIRAGRDRRPQSRDQGPAAAAAEVANRMDGGAKDLELERLQSILRDNILTSEVKRNGIGAIDPARFERSIDQVGEDSSFRSGRRPPTFSTTNSCRRSTAG